MINLNLETFEQSDRLSKLFSGESLTTPEGKFNFESLIVNSNSIAPEREQSVIETQAALSPLLEVAINEVEIFYETPFVEFNHQYFDANINFLKDTAFENTMYEMPQIQNIIPITWDIAILNNNISEIHTVFGFESTTNMLFEDIIPQTNEPFDLPLHHLITTY